MSKINVIELTSEQLRHMQLLQLDILKEFDRICRKHNLKYTLCGGSMLGAVRHKGFIPWDDDIDVSLLREDYEKFCEICKTELDTDKFFLQTMDTDPEYRLIYGRILLNGTAYVRAGQEHIKAKNGIFIDIFPRDNRSDIAVFRFIQSALALLMRKTLYSPVGALRSSKKIYRMIYKVLSKLPKSFVYGLLKIIKVLNFNKKTKGVACYGLMGPREKNRLQLGVEEYKKHKADLRKESKEKKAERKELQKGLQRIYFEEVVDMDFEDMKVMVSKHYDSWLKMNFDNYMQLPPENKRVMHQTVSYYSFGKYDE